MKEKFAALGSLAITAALSTCCMLPLLLASLGMGTLGLGSVIRPARPYMIAAAAVLLAFGFWRVYSRPTQTRNRALMWISSAALVVVAATPYAAARLRGPDALDEPGTRRVVVHIADLEFAACCETPAKEALDALPGVRRVRVDPGKKEAVLTLDPEAQIDNDTVTRTLQAVNHRGHLKQP